MKLLIKQQHAIFYLKDMVTEEVLYGGAAGGGKSALGCLWLMEMCQKHPGTRWLMGRSKLKTLKETTLNTFFELATILKLGSQFNYKSADNIIYWKNGSEIILKDLFLYPSDPNFDSLGSLEIILPLCLPIILPIPLPTALRGLPVPNSPAITAATPV